MHLEFLGAAGTVTGSQYLLETDRARILVDCGMFQGSREEGLRNRVPLAYDARSIDAVLLTHAHLDHSGLLPHLVDLGYRGPVFATPATVELAGLVLLDSGKLQEEFARRDERRARRDPFDAEVEAARERHAFREVAELAAEGEGAARRHGPQPELRVDLDEPLYTEADARRAIERFRPVEYGEEREVAPGIVARFDDAGHILGSAIVTIRTGDRRGAERTIVFSGDLGRPRTPIIRDPTVVTAADYLVVESTYGGREHEPRTAAVGTLAAIVREVAARGGVLLIPAFSIGRTQELVWALDRLLEAGEIPHVPLYLDSPMASHATEIYRRYPGCYDAPTLRLLQEGESPLDYPGQSVTNDVRVSEAIRRAPRPHVIIASNGTLTGGRALGHLRDLIADPTAVLLFVGFQGEGTLGAILQAGAPHVVVDGKRRRVRCAVRSISGFSAHADEPELLEWIANFVRGKEPDAPGRPRRVFLVHGDPEAQGSLEPKVRALGLETAVPAWRERVTLD